MADEGIWRRSHTENQTNSQSFALCKLAIQNTPTQIEQIFVLNHSIVELHSLLIWTWSLHYHDWIPRRQSHPNALSFPAGIFPHPCMYCIICILAAPWRNVLMGNPQLARIRSLKIIRLVTTAANFLISKRQDVQYLFSHSQITCPIQNILWSQDVMYHQNFSMICI